MLPTSLIVSITLLSLLRAFGYREVSFRFFSWHQAILAGSIETTEVWTLQFAISLKIIIIPTLSLGILLSKFVLPITFITSVILVDYLWHYLVVVFFSCPYIINIVMSLSEDVLNWIWPVFWWPYNMRMY